MPKKLSRAQFEALQQIASKGPCQTTTCTYGDYVSGACAQALIRLGFAKASGFAPYSVSITDEGRAALLAAEEERKRVPRL